MKKTSLILTLLASLAVTSLTMTANAADKNVTITGTALCAKCALHQSDKCQTVVQSTEAGWTVNYYLTGKTAKAFHANICSKTKGEKVKVTGTVQEKDGKEMLKASKIEEVK